MCLGDDLFQPVLDSFWRRPVRKCGRGQGEHRGNWLAQVMGGLLDGAWPRIRIGQIPPGSGAESTACPIASRAMSPTQNKRRPSTTFPE